jgi:hypothetical protein
VEDGRDARELPSPSFRVRLPAQMVEKIDAEEPLLGRNAAIQALLADGWKYRELVADRLKGRGPRGRRAGSGPEAA